MIDKFAKLSPNQKTVIVALVLVFLVFPAIMGYRSLQFRVVSSDPSPGGKTNVYGVAVVNYSRPITTDSAVIQTSPVFSFTTRIDDKKLVIIPKDNLQDKGAYTLTIENVCDKNKPSVCTNYSIHFTVDSSIAYSNLSKEQQNEVIRQTDAEFEDSPILSALPVREENFLIDQRTVETSRFVIIKPNIVASGMTEEEYTALYSKYYQEGRKYLKDRGYALESDKYKVVSQAEFNTLVAGE